MHVLIRSNPRFHIECNGDFTGKSKKSRPDNRGSTVLFSVACYMFGLVICLLLIKSLTTLKQIKSFFLSACLFLKALSSVLNNEKHKTSLKWESPSGMGLREKNSLRYPQYFNSEDTTVQAIKPSPPTWIDPLRVCLKNR